MTETQIAQLVFIAIIFVPSLLILGGIAVALSRVLPVFLRQSQQLIDNNSELTKIAQQNANQIKISETAIQENTTAVRSNTNEVKITNQEIAKQTTAIDSQTLEIKGQSLDFRNYQTLVSDNLSAHSDRIEVQGAKIEANTASINVLKSTLEGLPQQIVQAVHDELACAKLLNEFQSLRYEVQQILNQQQRRITGTIPAVAPLDKPTTS